MNQVTDEEMQEHYDNFFQEVFVECEVKMICILYFHDQLPHFPCVKLKNVKKNFPAELWQMITISVL